MIRMPLSAIGGVGLALVLFWLLALLVAPPEEEFEMLEMSRPIDVVEAPDMPSEPSGPVPPVEALPEPPAQASPPSVPPDPAPLPDSELALPEPELVEPELSANIDEPLPELVEKAPEPEPMPEPRPEPPPEPRPEPRPAPERAPQPVEAPSVERSEPSPLARAPSGSPQAEPSDEPVMVGQVSPVSRVPPEYPRRAQRRGLEGTVELEFVIRRDGRVDPDSLRVIDANPRNVFEKAAREAVKQWRFDPSPQLRRARQRLEFTLR